MGLKWLFLDRRKFEILLDEDVRTSLHITQKCAMSLKTWEFWRNFAPCVRTQDYFTKYNFFQIGGVSFYNIPYITDKKKIFTTFFKCKVVLLWTLWRRFDFLLLRYIWYASVSIKLCLDGVHTTQKNKIGTRSMI